MVIITSLVIVVDQILQTFAYEINRSLSVFVGLIITNCIVMGRAGSLCHEQSTHPKLLDGIGNGLGYSAVLIFLATVREVIGNGSWFGITLFEKNHRRWLVYSQWFVVTTALFILCDCRFYCNYSSLEKDQQEAAEFIMKPQSKAYHTEEVTDGTLCQFIYHLSIY